MSDVRQTCLGCCKAFAPLSSERGVNADYCFDCLIVIEKKGTLRHADSNTRTPMAGAAVTKTP
jgi:hypothetical protein